MNIPTSVNLLTVAPLLDIPTLTPVISDRQNISFKIQLKTCLLRDQSLPLEVNFPSSYLVELQKMLIALTPKAGRRMKEQICAYYRETLIGEP